MIRGTIILLAMVVMTFAAQKKRQSRLSLGLVGLLMLLLGAGCAGSVKKSVATGGTPSGDYTLTLTGSSGTGANAITHSMNVTLVVN
jgi:hypothetical protein